MAQALRLQPAKHGENTIYRCKRIIGGEMRARTLAGHRTETRMACKILNKMTRLGMPESYRAA